MESHKSHVPNHQAAYILMIIIPLYFLKIYIFSTMAIMAMMAIMAIICYDWKHDISYKS